MRRFKITFLFGFALLALSACGQEVVVPDDVLMKAKEAMTSINSGRFQVDVSLDSMSEGTLNLDGSLAFAFDGREVVGADSTELHLDFLGDMETEAQSLNLNLDAEFIRLASDYYVRVNELASNDPNLQVLIPLVNPYKGGWLQIAEDFIPENLQAFQSEDEASALIVEQMKQLLVSTDLFTIQEVLGMKKVNERNAYHLALAPNAEGFRTYFTQVASMNGEAFAPEEIDSFLESLAYINRFEVYIDVENYYVYRVDIQMMANGEGDGQLNLDLTLTAELINDEVQIEAPASSTPFNPLNLMLSLGASNALAAPDETNLDSEVGLEDNSTEASEEGVDVTPSE